MSKQLKIALALFIALALSLFASASVFAAAPTATTATIAVTVTQDDGKTPVTGLSVVIEDAAGNTVGTISSGSDTAGVYTTPTISTLGTYYLTFSDEVATDPTETIHVAVTAFSTKAIAAKMTWATTTTTANTKTGVLGGTVDSTSGAAAAVTVEAYNSTISEQTTTDTNGNYKFYLPAGAYTVLDFGTARNDYATVTVIPGQMNGPLANLNYNKTWGTDDSTLGLSTVAASANSLAVTGVANPGTTVTAFSVTGIYGSYTYTYLGSSTTGKAANGAKTGAFSIKLSSYPTSGENIEVRVTDSALDKYEAAAPAIPYPTFALSAKATYSIATPVVITLSDASKQLTSPEVLAEDGTSGFNTVDPSEYTIIPGKSITFDVGCFTGVGSTYTVQLVQSDYTGNPDHVSFSMTASTTAAPAIKGTFTASAGTYDTGSTKITASKVSVPTTDILVYKTVSSSATKPEYLSNVLITGYSLFTPGADIDEMSSGTIIDIYDINSSTHQVVATSRITLTAANIKAPAITTTSTSVNGTTITLSTNVDGSVDFLQTSVNPDTSTFTVKDAGVTDTVTHVTVNATNVSLTLTTAVIHGDAVTVKYTKPSTSYLQDTHGNAVATTSTLPVATNSTISPINTATIVGVAAPVLGGTPTSTITATSEYTATISWSPNDGTFAGGQVYTATITITPKAGYTLTGVAANFFTVYGATATNTAGSGVVTAVFPATAAPAAVTPASAATSDATHIVITMSSDLTGIAGDPAAFTIGGVTTNSPTVTGVSVSGSTVTLTLYGSIVTGDLPTVSYIPTTTNDLTNGTPVAAFSGLTVSNNI